MARAESRTRIPVPPAEVSAVLAEPGSLADWDPSVRAAEPLEGPARGPGARARITVGFYGRPIEVTYELVDDRPGERLVYTLQGRRVRGRRTFELTAADGATEVTDTLEVTLAGPARLLDRGLQLALGGLTENAMAGLTSRLTAIG